MCGRAMYCVAVCLDGELCGRQVCFMVGRCTLR